MPVVPTIPIHEESEDEVCENEDGIIMVTPSSSMPVSYSFMQENWTVRSECTHHLVSFIVACSINFSKNIN